MAYRNWFQWVDTTGKTRLTRVDTGSLLGGVARLAIQNVSNAGLIGVTAASVGGPYTEPGLGTFPSVLDNLQLTYQDEYGTNFQVNVPAPFDSLFLPDGVTAGGLTFTAFNAVLQPTLLSPENGGIATTFLAGLRTGGRSLY